MPNDGSKKKIDVARSRIGDRVKAERERIQKTMEKKDPDLIAVALRKAKRAGRRVSGKFGKAFREEHGKQED